MKNASFRSRIEPLSYIAQPMPRAPVAKFKLSDVYRRFPRWPQLQHAVPLLAYCDYLMGRHGQLQQHCSAVVRRAGLACKIVSRIWDVSAPSYTATDAGNSVPR